MKTLFKILSILFFVVCFCSCEKPSKCECNTPFVLGNYYQPGDVVSNRNACWMFIPDGQADYIEARSDEPRDPYPLEQDIWIKVCE